MSQDQLLGVSEEVLSVGNLFTGSAKKVQDTYSGKRWVLCWEQTSLKGCSWLTITTKCLWNNVVLFRNEKRMSSYAIFIHISSHKYCALSRNKNKNMIMGKFQKCCKLMFS